jgi:hypothetical protein
MTSRFRQFFAPRHPSQRSAPVIPEMELNEFIKTTLLEVQQGVQAAIVELESRPSLSYGRINPGFQGEDGRINWKNDDYRQNVEFDIAITVSNKQGASGRAGLKIWVADVGGDLSRTAERSTVNRIKFTIPILPAVSPIEWGSYAPRPVASLEARVQDIEHRLAAQDK